jgi:hypothetical protein
LLKEAHDASAVDSAVGRVTSAPTIPAASRAMRTPIADRYWLVECGRSPNSYGCRISSW